MPSLLDPPPVEIKRLLQVIASGMAFTDGHQWPVWQWVVSQLDREGIDAEEVYKRLPVWQNNYGFLVYAEIDPRSRPSNNAQVQLSVAGMHHTDTRATDREIVLFLAALSEAVRFQRDVNPTPTQSVTTTIDGSRLVEVVQKNTGIDVTPQYLHRVLRAEPTSRGLAPNGPDWKWYLTDIPLGRYRAVEMSIVKYLAVLEGLVGIPADEADRFPLPPTAILDALDHLDLAWRRRFEKPLIDLRRASPVASLTQLVQSAEEFESRCSSIAILLGWLNTRIKKEDAADGQEKGTLAGMQARLREALGDAAERSCAAVDDLRHVHAIRTAQQHRETEERAARARVALGLASYENDWQAAWEQLRHRIVNALRVIREEIED